MRQVKVKYPLFEKALSDLAGDRGRMNNNPVLLDNVEDTKRVSWDE
jgi:hypothetical protein